MTLVNQDDVDELITRDPPGVWVAFDVVQQVFPDLRKSRIYQLAKHDQWRTAPIRGARTRSRQYNLNDVAATWRRRRKATP